MGTAKHATELYDEFMCAIYSAIDTSFCVKCYILGRKWSTVLKIRERYAPRFFAMGIDLWICSEHVQAHGIDEYWILLIDLWHHLMSERESHGSICYGAPRNRKMGTQCG